MAKYMEAPFELYLRQEQYNRLRALADHRGTSISGLIAHALDQMLANAPEDVDELVRQWQSVEPWPVDRPIEEDPLWGIVGLGDAGVSDLAENHDQYIVELLEEESQPCPVKSL